MYVLLIWMCFEAGFSKYVLLAGLRSVLPEADKLFVIEGLPLIFA